MIKVKDVITIKVPIPDINTGLAKFAHMYIYVDNSEEHKLVKTQTFKPQLVTRKLVKNYIDSDLFVGHHPFNHRSLIDLDKYFCFNLKIQLDGSLKTPSGISDDLHNEIFVRTANLSTCNKEEIDTSQLLHLNHKISSEE